MTESLWLSIYLTTRPCAYVQLQSNVLKERNWVMKLSQFGQARKFKHLHIHCPKLSIFCRDIDPLVSLNPHWSLGLFSLFVSRVQQRIGQVVSSSCPTATKRPSSTRQSASALRAASSRPCTSSELGTFSSISRSREIWQYITGVLYRSSSLWSSLPRRCQCNTI